MTIPSKYLKLKHDSDIYDVTYAEKDSNEYTYEWSWIICRQTVIMLSKWHMFNKLNCLHTTATHLVPVSYTHLTLPTILRV